MSSSDRAAARRRAAILAFGLLTAVILYALHRGAPLAAAAQAAEARVTALEAEREALLTAPREVAGLRAELARLRAEVAALDSATAA
ncbi:MAG: hypothetical protein KDD82_14695, partial [Planctomycetes bacterium]|nr:hypothetical protein [Planctomycetota bacterium]